MTNKYNNWERLLELIEWQGITLNKLAKLLGMSRTESLYNIKRGHYGISDELATKICELYPQVDRTWLLTGSGTMLAKAKNNATQRPYYRNLVEESIMGVEELKCAGKISVPYLTGYDFVMRSASKAMCDKQCAIADLFLRREEVANVVQGNEYVLILEDGSVLWRKVRFKRGSDEWRLVARNRMEFPDVYVHPATIQKAWRVVARLAVMTS